MKAIHLPGRSQQLQFPQYSFPLSPPPASALSFSSSLVPVPTATGSGSTKGSLHSAGCHAYQIRVITTTLTRSELIWEETLRSDRFSEAYGPVPGHDVLGIVTAVYPWPASETAPRFVIGDRVLALLGFDRDGAAAEYTLASEYELAAAPLPQTSGNCEEELTALPLSGLSAWQALFKYAKLEPPIPSLQKISHDQKVLLIVGFTGAVGYLAVQIAKSAGLFVIGASSSSSASRAMPDTGKFWDPDIAMEYSEIGQDHSRQGLDTYCRNDNAVKVDVILDTTGGSNLLGALQSLLRRPVINSSPSTCRLTLATGAKIVSIAHPLAALRCPPETLSDLESSMRKRKATFEFFVVEPNGEQLGRLVKLAEMGQLKGLVRQSYALEQGAAAMEEVEGGGRGPRGMGKIVLRVAAGG